MMIDIFTLDKTNYTNGRIINEIDSVLWVERYDKPGEFTIIGDPSPQFRQDLSEGTLISHPGTREVMMVEDHLIEEKKDESPKVKITGRSALWVMMENRVITTSQFGSWIDDISRASREHILALSNTWEQITSLIYRYLENSEAGVKENLPNFRVINDISGESEDPKKVRSLNTPTFLHDEITKLLVSADLGLKLIRVPLVNEQSRLELHVHKGKDISKTVRFDWNYGELEEANYLWSSKNYKNGAYVDTDQFVLRHLPFPGVGWDTRIMPITPDDLEYDEFRSKITVEKRANVDIKKNNKDVILSATVSKKSVYDYGIDYNIGDIVYVVGNYDVHQTMRVIEHASSSDENGDSFYPTLGPILKPVSYKPRGFVASS